MLPVHHRRVRDLCSISACFDHLNPIPGVGRHDCGEHSVLREHGRRLYTHHFRLHKCCNGACALPVLQIWALDTSEEQVCDKSEVNGGLLKPNFRHGSEVFNIIASVQLWLSCTDFTSVTCVVKLTKQTADTAFGLHDSFGTLLHFHKQFPNLRSR